MVKKEKIDEVVAQFSTALVEVRAARVAAYDASNQLTTVTSPQAVIESERNGVRSLVDAARLTAKVRDANECHRVANEKFSGLYEDLVQAHMETSVLARPL